MLTVVSLHFGGAGTYTVAFMVSLTFLLIFVLSFALGSVPSRSRRFSRKWIAGWLKASLPRLVVAGAFSAAFFIASSFSGDGNAGTSATDAAVCNRPLAAITADAVTAQRVQAAAAAMRQIQDAAGAGDEAEARVLFFEGDAHNLTHDIDPPLRSLDVELAKRLCQSVLVLETKILFPGELPVVEQEAGMSAQLLDEAAQVLVAGR